LVAVIFLLAIAGQVSEQSSSSAKGFPHLPIRSPAVGGFLVATVLLARLIPARIDLSMVVPVDDLFGVPLGILAVAFFYTVSPASIS